MTRYLVISMSLFWAQASQAATHQVRFCVEYSVDFVDALSTTGDDFYRARSREARSGRMAWGNWRSTIQVEPVGCSAPECVICSGHG